MGMKKKIEGIQFTTRYWLQGKVRLFIKELDYSIEKVSGFNELDKKTKDDLLEWKKHQLINIKRKLAECYGEIVDDMASDDVYIFKKQLVTEKVDIED